MDSCLRIGIETQHYDVTQRRASALSPTGITSRSSIRETAIDFHSHRSSALTASKQHHDTSLNFAASHCKSQSEKPASQLAPVVLDPLNLTFRRSDPLTREDHKLIASIYPSNKCHRLSLGGESLPTRTAMPHHCSLRRIESSADSAVVL